MKFSYSFPRPPSQSGQALLEYVLLLVVSVSLVLALMMQLFQPLQKFLTSYMGDYTKCLLETGELPSLGGDDKSASDEGCSAKFEAASLAGGRPAKPDSAGGGKSTSAKSSTSSTNSSGNAGSSASNGGGGRFFKSPHSTQGGDGKGAQAKTTEIPIEPSAGGGFFRTSTVDRFVGRERKTTALAISGMTEAEKKKLEKKESLATRTIANDGPGMPAKKVTVKPPDPPIEAPPEDKPLTIGNFMRMLFIIAIILAIVVFVGGQVLQMSKSYDK